jgi:hypothetical protein
MKIRRKSSKKCKSKRRRSSKRRKSMSSKLRKSKRHMSSLVSSKITHLSDKLHYNNLVMQSLLDKISNILIK